MSAFRFVSYMFVDGEAAFTYRDDAREYVERVRFSLDDTPYNEAVLDRALFLAFLLIGTSYYKVSPTRDVVVEQGALDDWQADFLNHVYQEGMSQFAFENNLTRADLAHFTATGEAEPAVAYTGTGILSLQSGGKDSLLVASQLQQGGDAFAPFYISNGPAYPEVLDELGVVVAAQRLLDREALRAAAAAGGRDGHVPVTCIVMAIALVQAILLGKNTVLTAIGHEGDEPHDWIGDLLVNHQWAKTWQAEQFFAEYVRRYVSPDIRVGSPLRSYTELKIAELFAEKAWPTYGRLFSSCNLGNYKQGANNRTLTWCGDCPKCANSYLLFAPFVSRQELDALFGGESLLERADLHETFKGLLGIDNTMKPFECVGEVDEMRLAYHMAVERGYTALPFEVPRSQFNKDKRYPAQTWIKEL